MKLARKEYYPDFTISANYFYRSGPFLDMWNLTASIPLPIYQKTKQDQAVLEARASLSEAKQELQATELHACRPPSVTVIPWQRPPHG